MTTEMSLKSVSDRPALLINGCRVENVLMEEALQFMQDAITARRHETVCFINAHCVNTSVIDQHYQEILRNSGFTLLCDGSGLKIAGLLAGVHFVENVNGTDMFPLLCAQVAKRGQSVFLLGAKPGVAQDVAVRMNERFPELQFAGIQHGYYTVPHDEIIQQINASGAQILLVAFGVPQQEKWIATHRHLLNVPVVMGVGGLFDFYSGRIPRAPALLRKTGLEWTWRLAMEPGRMWRRYLVGNLVFLMRIIAWRAAGSLCRLPHGKSLRDDTIA